MLQSSKMPRRIVAAIALSLSTIAIIAPSAQAVPAYYPSGPQLNVPISTVEGGGWTLCWSGLYADSASLADIQAACDQRYLLLAAGAVGASDYLLAAAGERDSIFAPTGSNVTTLNNGTYWYFNTGASMGFSPNSTISQSSADVSSSTWNAVDATTPYRLSWHLSGGTSLNGGWRIGGIITLNNSRTYMRAIYQQSAPPIPQLLVDAVNVGVNAGQAVPADYRVLGLHGTDTVSDVVLEYAGTSVWGDVFGPSTTPPTAPGSYSVSVKSYKLTSSDPTYYNGQYKHSAVLTIRWVPTPITDAALAGLPTNNAVAPKYTGKGASVTGDNWSVEVNGAPVSAAGGKLLTDPGAVLAVSGNGFRPFSAVRIFLTPTELGSVWTDATGHFAKSVTVPNSAAGAQNLQVNGYSPAGAVRSVNVALQVGTTRQIVKQFVFGPKLAALNSGMESSIAAMMAEVPSAPWTVHLYVATSAASDHGSAWKLANARVRAVVDRVRSQLEAAGITVVVESTVWNQPGLSTSAARQLRIVYVDLTW